MKKYAVVVCILALFIVTALVTTPQLSRAAGPWYVAPGGSDGNDCLSAISPCASINGALNKPGFVAGDTILVATGVYTGTGNQVILLNKNAVLSGGWDSTFTAQGGTSTLDGQANQLWARRGLTVNSSVVATVDHFAIQNSAPVGSGGGIYNQGYLTISNSTIRDNMSALHGGGVYNVGTLTITWTTISGNHAPQFGGGVFNAVEGTLIVFNSTLNDNAAQSTVGSGGGIYNSGLLELNNSTVSRNTGFYVGGIASDGTLVLNNVTISGNSAFTGPGGGISVNGGATTLRNSILFGNSTWPPEGQDCSANGHMFSAGYNLVGDTSGCTFALAIGDLIHVDPKLESLTDSPGYHPLLPNSPALNAGNPSGCMGSAGLLNTDQRGFPRFGRCDIGAYELQPIGYSVKTVNRSTALQDETLIYTIALTNGGMISITDVLVTDTLPNSLIYAANSLTATAGSYGYSGGVITWTGTLEPQQEVPIMFTAYMNPTVTLGISITNSAVINGGGEIITRTAAIRVDGLVCSIQKHSSDPVLTTGSSGSWDQSIVNDPTVLKDGAIYKMWYSGSNGTASRIGYATSADGLSWIKYGGNPVLAPSLPWEGSRIFGPTVISDTGIYKMWYGGSDGTAARIGYATSPDGITWTKQGNPVLDVGTSGGWEDAYVSRPAVVKIGNTYHLWYVGNDGITDRIGHATSTDGITWSKDSANPVLDLGVPGAWDWIDVYAPSVVAYGDKYLMWYSGATLPTAYQTGFAVSTDGINWSRQSGIIAEGGAGSFDSDSADYPAAILEGNQFKIWYSGLNSAGTYNIGYATAQVCSANPTPPGNNLVYLPLISKPPAPTCAAYYADNFSDPKSGWYTGEDSATKFAYVNGEYQIWIKNPNDGRLVTPGAKATDFTVSVSARRTSGTSGAYGLLFGINEDWNQFYEVLIDANAFSVWRYNNGWTALQNWTTSNAIATGTSWNRLKVVRNGSLITVYINGQQVTNINDNTLVGLRRIGLTVESYNTGVDTRFDDFALYPADCGSQVYRAAASAPFEMGKSEVYSGFLPPKSSKH